MMRLALACIVLAGTGCASPSDNGAPAANDWTEYETTVQGGEANTRIVVRVDLSARTTMPDAGRPQLLLLSVNMIDPADDGLSDRSPESQLAAIETAVREELAARVNGRYVGRVRRGGADEFYIYLPAGTETDTAHEDLEKRFAKHTWLAFAAEDPEWATYRDLLLPADGEK